MQWLDYILFLGVGQGFFLAAVLPRIRSPRVQANRVLAALLVVVSLILLLKISLPKLDRQIAVHFWGYRDTLAFLFGPLYYHYFRTLLYPHRFKRLHPLHYLPFLLHGAWVTIRNFSLSAQEIAELVSSGKLFPFWVIITFLLTLSYVVYLILAMLLFRNKSISRENPPPGKFVFIFSFVILTCIFTGIIFWFFWVLNFLFGIKILVLTDTEVSWIIIPFLTYFIGYSTIIHQDIYQLKETGKTSEPRMDAGATEELLVQLQQLMLTGKPYLDPELTLSQLASMLQTSSNKLSWLINNIYDCNFYDYINYYRTREFVERIRAGQHVRQTLIAIAYDSGFTSKSTFNRVFRKLMNETPGSFVKHLHNEKGTDISSLPDLPAGPLQQASLGH